MLDGARRRAALARMKTAMMKAAMSGLYHTGAHRLLAPYTQGVGVIFTLAHVRPEPERPNAFAPNRILEVTPGFPRCGARSGAELQELDVLSLDEATQRLKEGDDRRFACFTFDDGYRDNLEYAYPLFKRRSLPLTLYVPTDYPDGNGELWWLALEEIIARASEIELCQQRRAVAASELDRAEENPRLRGDLLVAAFSRRGDPAPRGACARRPLRGGHGRRLLQGS